MVKLGLDERLHAEQKALGERTSLSSSRNRAHGRGLDDGGELSMGKSW